MRQYETMQEKPIVPPQPGHGKLTPPPPPVRPPKPPKKKDNGKQDLQNSKQIEGTTW